MGFLGSLFYHVLISLYQKYQIIQLNQHRPISFTYNNLSHSAKQMEQKAIFIEQDAFKQQEDDIRHGILLVRQEMEALIKANTIAEPNVPQNSNILSSLLKIQELILSLPKILQQNYRQECLSLSFLFAQYMLSFQKEIVTKEKKYESTFSNQVNRFLPQSDLFNFLTIFELVAFQRMSAKLKFKCQPAQSKQYLQQAPTYFQDIIKEKLVDDSCVGCNQFFYKYHQIQTIINPKIVPIYFAYNSSKEMQQLIRIGLLKAPPTKLTINLLNLNNDQRKRKANQKPNNEQLNSQEKVNSQQVANNFNFLKLVQSILNQSGGYIVFGCYKMSNLSQNQLMPRQQQNLSNCASLNDIHFVIGQLLTEQERKRIQANISQIISSIQPTINIHKQIQIGFVPVQVSNFNKGYFLNTIFQPKQPQQRHLLLIAVKPNASTYKVTGQYQQSAQQDVDQGCFGNSGYNEKVVCLYRRKESPQKFQDSEYEDEELQLKKFLQGAETMKYFDAHHCKFDSEKR